MVDDEAANLKLLARMLESRGYENLVPIQDSRRVLEEYRKAKTSLILLDLRMPNLDGFEVLTLLRELGDPLLPPIVVLTAEKGRETLLRAFENGARDFLTKPFEMEELLARVRNMLDVQSAQSLLYEQREILDSLVRSRTEELLRSRMQVIEKLARASEYRDNETGRHIIRVGQTAALLSERTGMDAQYQEDMLHAAPMHDVGKIGIPDAILLKPAKLEPHEFEIMKTHAVIGAKLLDGDGSFRLLSIAREIAGSHHEKWDGTGYPEGLHGEDIPLGGASSRSPMSSTRSPRHGPTRKAGQQARRWNTSRQAAESSSIRSSPTSSSNCCRRSSKYASICPTSPQSQRTALPPDKGVLGVEDLPRKGEVLGEELDARLVVDAVAPEEGEAAHLA